LAASDFGRDCDIEEKTKMSRLITHEEISRKAYEIWEARGQPEDSAQENWYLAEDVLGLEPLKGPS